ncbi:MAG: ABC transporter ATP-binding protein [Gammaproteobacteria bacterium]|nr:ABC transporter ATP-binding protein [Gammaproteobacteria bacterium]
MTRLNGEALTLSLDGHAILKGVDFILQPGETWGVIGPNGAGKSTLLKVLAGLLRPDQGSLLLDSQPLLQWPARERARRIGYLPQAQVVHWPVSVMRVVSLGRLPHLDSWQQPAAEDWAIIQRAMEETDTHHLGDQPVTTLSGGERARVLLARVLAAEPTILLADEPVAALDPAHQLDMMALMASHTQSGGGAVIVLHDLRLASHFCDRLLLMHQGGVLAAGEPGTVLTRENLRHAYGIEIDSEGDPLALGWKRVPQAPRS